MDEARGTRALFKDSELKDLIRPFLEVHEDYIRAQLAVVDDQWGGVDGLFHDGYGPQHAVGRRERHHRPHEPARPRRVDAEEVRSPLDDGRRVKPTKGVVPWQTVVDRAGEPG